MMCTFGAMKVTNGTHRIMFCAAEHIMLHCRCNTSCARQGTLHFLHWFIPLCKGHLFCFLFPKQEKPLLSSGFSFAIHTFYTFFLPPLDIDATSSAIRSAEVKDMSERNTIDIGEVCRVLGTTSRTLRFYEEKGIIASTPPEFGTRRQNQENRKQSESKPQAKAKL